eukprot:m.97554 g.97554  ORF g.97554 m.97554 type:complete len:217 (-) comp15227_c1_seq2:645-1295(-)
MLGCGAMSSAASSGVVMSEEDLRGLNAYLTAHGRAPLDLSVGDDDGSDDGDDLTLSLNLNMDLTTMATTTATTSTTSMPGFAACSPASSDGGLATATSGGFVVADLPSSSVAAANSGHQSGHQHGLAGRVTTAQTARAQRSGQRKKSQLCRAKRLKYVATMQAEVVAMAKQNVELETELASLRRQGATLTSRIDRLKQIVASSIDIDPDLFFPPGA